MLLVRPSFDNLPTHYPFMLGLEQFKTEALLTGRLKKAGIKVQRSVELLSFSDTGGQVSAKLRHPDGAETKETFAYLLGSDGTHSTVRSGLGLKLEGETLDATWTTADEKIRWDRDPSEVVALLLEDEVALLSETWTWAAGSRELVR
jgi:2-polyprenyl-6-methoxyphenol hydroxylase-like FAD-dependent oxidoreductase